MRGIFAVLFISLIMGSFPTQASSTIISFLFILFIELVGLSFEQPVVDLLAVELIVLVKTVFEVEAV